MEKITVEKLSFRYPTATDDALKDITFAVEKGSFLLVCGHSGCGKTTLLRCLKKEIAPYGEKRGRILVDGCEIDDVAPPESAATIGFVMQNPENQIVTDTVWHELAFGLENLGVPTGVIRRRVAETAHFFGIGPWFEKSVNELSGGQKQILNLAAVMAMQPDVIILDEPIAQLDPIAAKEFLQTLRRVNEELGKTVILSEHRLDDMLPIADNVLYLSKAQRRFYGTPEEFAGWCIRKREEAFIPSLPAAVRLAEGMGITTDIPLGVKEGRRILAAHRRKPHTPAPRKEEVSAKPAAIGVKDIWFRYDRKDDFVLKGLAIQIRKGEMHCILGGNGSGKSTLLGVLCGLLKPSRGTVRRAEEMRTALLMQSPKTMFVCDTLQAELMENARVFHYARRDMEDMARTFGLLPHLEKHPYDLSSGEMQKAAIAKLLLLQPNVLLLDEPTKGMDAMAKDELAYLLKQLAASGMAVVIVTHDLEFAASHAQRCSMLFDGNVICSDEGRSFFLGNSFYTTAVNRMTRGILSDCVTVKDVLRYV